MAVKVVAVIPARYSSKRFQGKVLSKIQGQPLLFHVWNSLVKSKKIDRLIITTDDARIAKTAESFGAEVIKSSSKHKTGTDRVVEISTKVSGDIFLNVQADNLGIKTAFINSIIEKFKTDRKFLFGTVVRKIDNDDLLFDPNRVKALLNKDNSAIWFSRFPLPYLQNSSDKKAKCKQFDFWEHIGIYLFKRAGLKKYSTWKQSELEKAESLEQLRILSNGEKIIAYKTINEILSIDNKEDLRRVS